MNPPNPNVNPNQVCVTLTTHRNKEGRITGTSCSRAIQVPAQHDTNPPDLSAMANGDEEYLLVKVSKKQKKCWVTYLDGDDPEGEHEFYWGTSVSYLVERKRSPSPSSPRQASPEPPRPPRLARVQLGEMVERRIEEGARVRRETTREST